VAFGSSLDQVGTFGRTVEHAALLLQVVAGRDPLDSTCADRPPPDLLAGLEDGAAGLVVGVPEEYFPDSLDPDIRRVTRGAVEALARAGAEVRPVSLPHTRFAISTYYITAPAEAASNLARYDGVRYGLRAGDASAPDFLSRSRSAGFGAEVKRRIMLGTYVLSAGYYDQYYGRAQQVRARIAADFRAAFDGGIDVIFAPTTPGPAFRLGERISDPYAMYLADVFTVTANLVGIPAISVPVGRVDGLPVGGQLLADRWHDALLVRAAAALEQAVARSPA
jgi:aspartyl-tRNA(Asn)/glutamyl-tRNA(Gln) amidotransferase subunit A